MSEFQFKELTFHFTVTREELQRSHSIRLRDPWWRRPLVWARILKPRYRTVTLNDQLFGDGAKRSSKLRGFVDQYSDDREKT